VVNQALRKSMGIGPAVDRIHQPVERGGVRRDRFLFQGGNRLGVGITEVAGVGLDPENRCRTIHEHR
jgi:hypothetical protein